MNTYNNNNNNNNKTFIIYSVLSISLVANWGH